MALPFLAGLITGTAAVIVWRRSKAKKYYVISYETVTDTSSVHTSDSDNEQATVSSEYKE